MKLGDKLIQIFTHPTNKEVYISYSPTSLPSDTDLGIFLRKKREKTMVIAERNIHTGKILGYTIIRKTKDTPSLQSSFSLLEDLNEYMRYQFFEPPNLLQRVLRKLSGKVTSTDYDIDQERFLTERKDIYSGANREALDTFCKKYHLQYKNIPAKDNEEEKGEHKGLEKKVAVSVIIASFVIGIFFLSSNITGNAISNITGTNSGLLGIILFIVGLIGLIFSRKNL